MTGEKKHWVIKREFELVKRATGHYPSAPDTAVIEVIMTQVVEGAVMRMTLFAR